MVVTSCTSTLDCRGQVYLLEDDNVVIAVFIVYLCSYCSIQRIFHSCAVIAVFNVCHSCAFP